MDTQNSPSAQNVQNSSSVTVIRELFRSDFEVEGVKSYYKDGIYLKNINGWTGSQYIEVNGRFGGSDDSSFAIELNRDPTGKFTDAPSITRTVETIDGAEYRLSFDFASRPRLTEEASHIGIFINGVQVSTWAANGQGSNQPIWQQAKLSFTGDGEPAEIEFRELGQDIEHGRGMFLDNIALTEAAPSTALPADETTRLLIDVLGDAADQSIVSVGADVYLNGEIVGHAAIVLVGGAQQIQFTPNAALQALQLDATATLILNYTLNDSGEILSETVEINVAGLNNAPLTAQDTYIMRYDGQITVDVRDNDHDAENDSLSVTHINGTELILGEAVRIEVHQGVKPVRADITLLENGELQIDHVGGNSTRDFYFEYTLSDGVNSVNSLTTVQILPKIKSEITEISEDTDTAGDFRTADLNGLTIHGSVTGALLPEESMQITWRGSGGWQTVSVNNDTLIWSFDDNTSRSNGDVITYTTRIQDSRGRNLDVDRQDVVFESDVSPAEITITDFSDDTGFSDSDRITADRTLVVHGTLSEELGPDDRIEVTWDGGLTWFTATVTGTDWFYDSSHFEHAQRARPLYEVRVINDQGHIGNTDEARVIVDALSGRFNTISLDAISDDTGTAEDFFTQDNTLTISGSMLRNLGNDQMVWLYSDDDPDWRVQATVNSDDTWSAIDSRANELNSEITYTAKIIDLAGNVMDEDSQLVVIDNTAPTVDVAITAISEDSGYVDFRTADLDGLVISGSVGTLATDETVQISLNGTDWFDIEVTGRSWNYNDTSIRADGDLVTYQVRVIDNAGNIGSQNSQQVIFDQSTPSAAVAITAISEDTGVADFRTSDLNGLTVSGSVSGLAAGDEVQISSDSGVSWTSVDIVNNGWSFTDNQARSDGDQVVYQVRVINQYGAEGNSDSQEVVFDTSASVAAVSISTLDADTGLPDFRTSDMDGVSIGGTVALLEADERVQVSLNGFDWLETDLDRTTGVWSYRDDTARDNGEELLVHSRVIDGADNIGKTDIQLVVFDNQVTNSGLEITSISEDTGIIDFRTADMDGIVISGRAATLQPDEWIQISLDNGASWQYVSVNSTDTSWSFDDAAIRADGDQVTYQVRIIDGAGNVGSTTSQVVMFDSNAPVRPGVPVINAAEAAGGVNGAELSDGVQVEVTLGQDSEPGDVIKLMLVQPDASVVIVEAVVPASWNGSDFVTVTIPVASIPESGSYSLQAAVTNSDGYVSEQSNAISFSLSSVSDVADTDADANTVAENAVVGTVVQITASATDADTGDQVSYSLIDDAGGLFAVDSSSGVITVAGILNYEDQSSYQLVVKVTSSDGSSSQKSFTVTVQNVNEAPTDISLSSNTVDENNAGAIIGDLTVTDPDNSDSHSFTLSDDRFEIVAGQLKLKQTVELDYETESVVSVTVTATDLAGESYTETLQIEVQDHAEIPGGESQVTNLTGGNQVEPDTAALADGGYVTVFTDQSGADGNGYGVFAQRFDSNGNAAGEEVQVNTYTNSHQKNASVSGLNDGGYVVTWDSNAQDSSNNGIYGQRFDAQGNKVGDEFYVNSNAYDHQQNSSVASLADGSFIVSWESSGQDGSYYGVYGQRFDQDGDPLGREFRISSETYHSQFQSQVTALSDGGFVASWSSYSQDQASTYGIFTQRYDADGNAVGDEFQVNTYTASNQSESAVIGLADGGYVVSWQSYGQDGSYDGIYGQRFDAQGNVTGSEFQISTHGLYQQSLPDMADVPGGGFVAVWQSNAQDGNSWGVYAQRFDASGYKLGHEFLVTETVKGAQTNPAVEVLNDGTVVVSYESTYVRDGAGNGTEILQAVIPANKTWPGLISELGESQVTNLTAGAQVLPDTAALTDGGYITVFTDQSGADGSGYGVFMQRFDAAGNALGEAQQVNTYTNSHQQDATVAGLANGEYVVTWASYNQDGNNYGIYGQRFAGDGSTLGDEFQINTYTSNVQQNSSVSAGSDGSFVVTWESNGQDGSVYGIYGQRYDADGNAVGDEFHINSATYHHQLDTQVAVLNDGGFVVSWTSYHQDQANTYGIFAQRYDADGNAVGDEFQVNSYTLNSQTASALVSLADGGFVISWQSVGQDGSGSGIYGQRYTAEGSPVGAEFQINTYGSSEQTQPDIADTTDGGFVMVWQSNGQDGSGYGIYAQRFDAGGNKVGFEFQVAKTTTGAQTNPAVEVLNDGTVVVSYESTHVGDGTGNGTEILQALIPPLGSESVSGISDQTPTINDQTTSDATPIITGTAAAVAQLLVSVAGAVYEVQVNNVGNWSLNTEVATPVSGSFDPDVNGTNPVTVIDKGNQNSATGNIIIDSVAPDLTLVDTGLATATPTFTGLVSDASLDRIEVTVNGTVYAAQVSGGEWSLTIPDADALATGSYTVSVTAHDELGNKTTLSDPFVVDATGPVLTYTAQSVTTDTTPTLIGTVDDPNLVSVEVVVNSVTYSAVVNGNNWSITLPDTDALDDGVYDVLVTALDAAGNTAVVEGSQTVDTTAPVVTVADIVLTADNTPTFNGTVTDLTIQAVEVTVNGNTYDAVVNAGQWSLTLPDADVLADGHYEVSAQAIDAAGLTGSAADSFEVDASAPQLTFVALQASSDSTPSLTGTVADENLDTVQVTVNGETYAATVSGNQWTLTLPDTDALADGNYVAAVTATDLAGNETSLSQPLIIDSTAPVITIADLTTTGDKTPTFSGTISDTSVTSIQVTVNGKDYAAQVNGSDWSLTLPDSDELPEGDYTVTAVATDSVGLSAAISDDFNVVATPPEVSFSQGTYSVSASSSTHQVGYYGSGNTIYFNEAITRLDVNHYTHNSNAAWHTELYANGRYIGSEDGLHNWSISIGSDRTITLGVKEDSRGHYSNGWNGNRFWVEDDNDGSVPYEIVVSWKGYTTKYSYKLDTQKAMTDVSIDSVSPDLSSAELKVTSAGFTLRIGSGYSVDSSGNILKSGADTGINVSGNGTNKLSLSGAVDTTVYEQVLENVNIYSPTWSSSSQIVRNPQLQLSVVDSNGLQTNCTGGGDPLILDLDGNGVTTLAMAEGVLFDIDADGDQEHTGWVAGSDGLLVRDINQDGQINDASELFGDQTLLRDGSKAETGFAALQDLDSNSDGVFDKLDISYNQLSVWQDKNSDGVVQTGELQSLYSAGIASITLTAHQISEVDNGNILGLESSWTDLNGREHQAVDAWLANEEISSSEAPQNVGAYDGFLKGTDSHDTLVAGSGIDILVGGAGDDILTGGEGRDTFIWQQGDQSADGVATDVIVDFNMLEDVLDLSALLEIDDQELDVIADYLSLTENEAGDAVLEVATNGAIVDQKIVLNDVSLESLADSVGSSGVRGTDLINHLIDDDKLII